VVLGATGGAAVFAAITGVAMKVQSSLRKKSVVDIVKQIDHDMVWKDGDSCESCKRAFSTTLRQHHCRVCGFTFCGNCSNQSVEYIYRDIEKPQTVRACGPCSKLPQPILGASMKN